MGRFGDDARVVNTRMKKMFPHDVTKQRLGPLCDDYDSISNVAERKRLGHAVKVHGCARLGAYVAFTVAQDRQTGCRAPVDIAGAGRVRRGGHSKEICY